VAVANTTASVQANYARYMRLGQALRSASLVSGRPVLYDVVLQVATKRQIPWLNNYGSVWSPEAYGGKGKMHAIANLWWSLPCNKYDCWDCCVGPRMNILNSTQPCLTNVASRNAMRGILPMVDAQDSGQPGFSKTGHWDYSAPGGWNHLDQLAVCLPATWQGPGLSAVEQHSHFALWAVLASPLLLAFDARKPENGAESACVAMVTNKRVVAISQDKLGVAGRRMKNIRTAPGRGGRPLTQLWGRPLSGNRVAILLLNRQDVAADITVTLEEAGFSGSAAPVQDAWTGATTAAKGQVTAKNVPPHGAFLAVLSRPSLAASVYSESASGSGSSGSYLIKKMKHDDAAAVLRSSSTDDRGFTCWGATSGLLFSKDPYHNTDCDRLNAKAGSSWVCNGQVWPPTREEGEHWASALNAVFRNTTKFYLYSDRDPFFYLASHACTADNVTLNKWIFNETITIAD